jgi:hypothetical protein
MLLKAIMVVILTLEYIKAFFFKNGVCIIKVLNNEEYTFSVFE